MAAALSSLLWISNPATIICIRLLGILPFCIATYLLLLIPSRLWKLFGQHLTNKYLVAFSVAVVSTSFGSGVIFVSVWSLKGVLLSRAAPLVIATHLSTSQNLGALWTFVCVVTSPWAMWSAASSSMGLFVRHFFFCTPHLSRAMLALTLLHFRDLFCF